MNIFYIPFVFHYYRQDIFAIFIRVTIKWWFCWYSWWLMFFSVFYWSWIHITLLAFKKLLNVLLLETEWSEVLLMWWSFLNSLSNIFIQTIPCNFNFIGKTVPFPSKDITFFLRLFYTERHHQGKLFEDYICYIFLNKAFKITRYSKIFIFKKVRTS